MKNNSKKISLLYNPMMVLILLGSFLSCKKDDPAPAKTEVEKVTEMLTSGGGWGTTLVTIDGVDVTEDLFSGFSITFNASTFTTTGISPVWLRQDTWTFKDETARIIIRGQDNKEITITEISATQLKLAMEWDQTTTEIEGGRKRSLKGKHEFVLNK